MYYPLQIPYILSKEFSRAVQYRESIVPGLEGFVICAWEMNSLIREEKIIPNIIIADGCIDLVMDFQNHQIGFVGMSHTNFEFMITTPCQFHGFRLKPGAFPLVTGIDAQEAMDNFIPLERVMPQFNPQAFFNLSFAQAKEEMLGYMRELVGHLHRNGVVSLFDHLADEIPETVAELAQRLHFSPRQTHRNFMKNFGFSPRKALNILRFQKCLQLLIHGGVSPQDTADSLNFYDQAHFIKDFKYHLGITPRELVNKYR